MEIELSIIIVNYNTKDLTLACIDSILKCNPRLLYEIIVVDNGSTDGSQEVFQELNNSTKLRFILHQKNLGFSKGNNSGIKKAIGQYILLLNSDTLIKRGALEELYEFAKHTPYVGAVGPRLLNEDGSIQPSVYNLPTIKRAFQHYWLGKKVYEKFAPKGLKPVEVEALVAAAFLITPQAIRKVGLLDEKYFMYFEDLDYCRKILTAGFKIYYIPTAEVVHLHGASGKNAASSENQWKRLIPSSKLYHGTLRHTIITAILWSGQKLHKLI
jgi:GT2 family glycosyltransferase